MTERQRDRRRNRRYIYLWINRYWAVGGRGRLGEWKLAEEVNVIIFIIVFLHHPPSTLHPSPFTTAKELCLEFADSERFWELQEEPTETGIMSIR